jgi:hypothetical protein
MNKINQFFDKSPLWQIYIFGWFFTGAFVAALFYGLQLIDPPNSKMLITGINCIKMGALTGILFGLMIMLMVSMMRKSQIFWDYAKVVEELIEAAKTKDELTSIFNTEFQELRKKCQGGPQIPELNRLYTIMKTKIQYIN